MADAPKCFKFVNEVNDVVFYATEGSHVYARVTSYDRADNRCLGECDPVTGELLNDKPKRGKAAKASEDAPAVTDAPAE